MTRIAFWNGELVAESSLQIAVADLGFMMGVTATERLRTFRGQLFRCEQHLARLRHSLEILGLAHAARMEQLHDVALQLVAENGRGLDADLDQGVAMFVTPGTGDGRPTVCVHTYPLPCEQWLPFYEFGQRLRISQVRQVPGNCWPAELKCRSRVHYYLADLETRAVDPEARALLLDQEGLVAEASTANVVMVEADGTLVSPELRNVLPGVSLGMLADLAKREGRILAYRNISPAGLKQASEVLLCSTSPCLVPVSSIDGQPIGDGHPGPVWRHLLAAWSREVGVDIRSQGQPRASL